MPTAGDSPVCPWCSATLRTADDARCPSCGAVLRDEAVGDEVPGVTRVDHEAIMRSRAPAQKSRGLIGWLSGEYQAPATPEPPETFALPDPEVRREMLRMELAALEAKAEARRAEEQAVDDLVAADVVAADSVVETDPVVIADDLLDQSTEHVATGSEDPFSSAPSGGRADS